MNFIQKYKKYKSKYLELKKLIGGEKESSAIKRIGNEVGKLSEELYKNIKLDENYNLTFEKISDNSRIEVIFPDDYPFKPPIIKLNNIIISISFFKWTPAMIFITLLYPPAVKPSDKKVLILCHNKLVTGSFEPLTLENHWYGMPFFPNKDTILNCLFKKYNLTGNPIFDTIDVLPGGTLTGDAFSDDFINFIDTSIEKKYDLVMVPDCGGPWVQLRCNDEAETKLIYLSLKLTKLVKPNGIIQFGKILGSRSCTINEKKYDSFISALCHHLEMNGFKTEIIVVDGIGENIIAQRQQR